jgi:hypothetical protein
MRVFKKTPAFRLEKTKMGWPTIVGAIGEYAIAVAVSQFENRTTFWHFDLELNLIEERTQVTDADAQLQVRRLSSLPDGRFLSSNIWGPSAFLHTSPIAFAEANFQIPADDKRNFRHRIPLGAWTIDDVVCVGYGAHLTTVYDFQSFLRFDKKLDMVLTEQGGRDLENRVSELGGFVTYLYVQAAAAHADGLTLVCKNIQRGGSSGHCFVRTNALCEATIWREDKDKLANAPLIEACAVGSDIGIYTKGSFCLLTSDLEIKLQMKDHPFFKSYQLLAGAQGKMLFSGIRKKQLILIEEQDLDFADLPGSFQRIHRTF